MQGSETITLDGRTKQRRYVLGHLLAGELTDEEAVFVGRVVACAR
jgi:hypothetical protein